jgi:alkylation response protein AidB-like acyl-CoA dehydrogenase
MEGRGLGAKLHDAPIYRTAIDFMFTLPLAAPVLGIARAAVSALETRIRKRLQSPNARTAAEQTAILPRIAEASAAIEAARALLVQSAQRFSALPGGHATPLDKAECRRNVAYSAHLCRSATQRVFEASGASSVDENSDLSRLWRDANVAAAHQALLWDVHGLGYGRERVGLPPVWQHPVR